MRFLELSLKAFGAFTERAPIELPDTDGAGLCVIYGANEAGKSTALRAIRALLYGFPATTPDDFVHRYADLRVGARLRFDDGETLAVMRHKKKKDSLYTYDDKEVCRSERLDALAEVVPESLFERFYGLDHPGLREGSAALLQDDGEVGRALFGAGLGVSNLGSVLRGLESDAADLFVPRGSKPRLNARIKAWNDAQKEIGQDALDPKVWAAQEDSVAAAHSRAEALAREIEAARRELARFERLKRSLPALARRQGAQQRLEALGTVAPLPEDFVDRLTGARATLRGAEQATLRAAGKAEREAASRASLILAPDLLGEKDRIEGLHQRVAGYEEALDQMPRRESRLAALDEEIEALLFIPRSELDLPRLAALRTAVSRRGATQTLANEGGKRSERLTSVKAEVAEAEADLERLRERLDSEGSPEADRDDAALRLALDRAVKLGPLDARIDEERNAYEEIDFEADRRARALGLNLDGPSEVDAAAYPGHELIDPTAEAFAKQATRRDGLRDEVQRIRSERRTVDEALATNRSQGLVPQWADVESRREERDRTWRELRRTAVDSDSPEPIVDRRLLADRFERELTGADALGDQLRIDAKRVAEQAALEAKAVRLDRDLEDALEREENLLGEQTAMESRWSEAWARTGVKAGLPEEMRGWRRGFDEWVGLLANRREAGLAVDRDTRARSEAIVALDAAMTGHLPEPPLTPSLASTRTRIDEGISRAESVLTDLDARKERRRRQAEAEQQTEDRLHQATHRRGLGQSAMAEWQAEWDEALVALDLAAGTRPELALARLEEMGRLVERLRERDDLADRVAKMGQDVAAFEEGVRALVDRCTPALEAEAPASATRRLQRELGDALNQQVLFEKSGEALVEAQEELEEAAVQSKQSDRALAELCAIAKVADEAALDEALRNWRQVEEANASLQQAEIELTNLAEGRSLVDLEAETNDLDSDVLAAQITRVEEQIARLAVDEKASIEALRSARDALEAMDGSGRVAELAAEAESTLAEIRGDVDRYVELRMAKRILEDEIERYRSENQAPLLSRAGEIFGALTLGAYPKIESDVDETGTQIRLVAVDPSNARVSVAGLSAGTRDQLFLAIRLASLEEAQRRGESMPLIADDVLIEFDDDRSRAALEVLAEIGQRNQILLFSHHLHIAEIAGEMTGRSHVIRL